jgi:CRP-like cAMP-binding protein
VTHRSPNPVPVTEKKLRAFPVFAELFAPQIGKLLPLAESRQIAKDEVLLAQGLPSRDLYLVDTGKFSLCLSTSAGREERCLLTLTHGEVVGWSALLDQPTWLATVTAIKDSSVLVIDGPALRQLCDTDHEIGYQVMRYLFVAVATRLHDTRLQLLDMYNHG